MANGKGSVQRKAQVKGCLVRSRWSVTVGPKKPPSEADGWQLRNGRWVKNARAYQKHNDAQG